MKNLNSSKIKFLVILFVFLFSFVLRLWNLNKVGRTWDEGAYVEIGNSMVYQLQKGNFSSPLFYETTDAPPLARYMYGIASKLDVSYYNNGVPFFNYDYTYSRLVSVFFSSLSVAVLVLFGIEFISFFVGVSAGIILSMLPFFLGLSQLATLESMLFFFFTTSIYLFLRFLKKPNRISLIITGVSIGLALLSKYTNILLIPLIFSILYFWLKYDKPKSVRLIFKKILGIFLVGLLTFISLWPMPWSHLDYVVKYNYNWRVLGNIHPDIEVFFGKLIHLPFFYYFVMFLITTPFLVIILFFIGSKYISDIGKNFKTGKVPGQKGNISEKLILYSLVLWFCIPFIQSFYNFRHHGIRFIIEIYAPLALISAIGLDYLINRFTKRFIKKLIILGLVTLYFLIILLKITPYYLDYFNIVVGGTKNVYEKRMFELGWWGEGIGEAGSYLKNNAPKNSNIGLAISPIGVFPKLRGYKVIEYKENEKYDFVVVNYFHILREGFDDSYITSHYKLVYTVKADGAVLVYVYKKL
ncbi:MAG TPA: phospholipid carrier-dependent glycosyltransferase [Candidatus Sulfotelmatobacter sp.]|nr:phospholipid carrier-dependent glycosyltransferase [Candidatus Sulfotelmatobacter sp.]